MWVQSVRAAGIVALSIGVAMLGVPLLAHAQSDDSGAAVVFTAPAIAVVTGILAAVTGALALVFRILQAGQAERIRELGEQLAAEQAQVAALQTAAAAHIDKMVTLMQGAIADSRDASLKVSSAMTEFIATYKEEQANILRIREQSADRQREILITLHALAQSQGQPLGDRRDRHVREVQDEAARLLENNGGTRRAIDASGGM